MESRTVYCLNPERCTPPLGLPLQKTPFQNEDDPLDIARPDDSSGQDQWIEGILPFP